MKDLTKGFPAKVIIFFAIPMIFGSIFQQFYNIADSKIVSTYVGTDAFAAVGATSVVSNTVIGFINSLTLGFAIPIANSFGGKDFKRVRKAVAGTVVLTTTFAIVLTAIIMALIPTILTALSTPEDIMDSALNYVRVILMGIVFTALYNMCANVLRAVGDSKTPLYCLIVAVVINIGLDLLFVRGLGMGIQGAAWATVISQAISGAVCLIYILVKFRVLLPEKGEWRVEGPMYGELFSTGIAMGLMSCVVNVGTIILQSAINSLGTAYVAAHTAARKLFDVLCVSLYCVGNAMTTYTSQNMGAGEAKRVRTGVKHALFIVWSIAAVVLVACWLFAKPLFGWLASTDDKTIIDSAVMYSRISSCFFFALGPVFVLRCTLQGMGRKIIPVCSSVLECFIKIMSASFLVPAFGYVGVAFTEPVSWVVMVIVLGIALAVRPPEKMLEGA